MLFVLLILLVVIAGLQKIVLLVALT